ncbi:hypothetical protein [Saccharopolyspora taberi]|uniref:Uncharacterized protein n=1 Tax=Saccharopolyspora taberi TaxID=60895 RepID=A0ABN3V4U2_9PSEU
MNARIDLAIIAGLMEEQHDPAEAAADDRGRQSARTADALRNTSAAAEVPAQRTRCRGFQRH